MMKTRITRMRSLVSVALVMAPPWDQTHWRTHGPRSTAAASLSRDKQTHLLAPSLGLSGWTLSTGCSSNCESATETQRHKPRHVLSATSLPIALPVLKQARNGAFKTQPKLSSSSVWVELFCFCLRVSEAAAGHFERRDMKTFQLSLCVNGSAHRSQGDRIVLLSIFFKKERERGQLIMPKVSCWKKQSG